VARHFWVVECTGCDASVRLLKIVCVCLVGYDEINGVYKNKGVFFFWKLRRCGLHTKKMGTYVVCDEEAETLLGLGICVRLGDILDTGIMAAAPVGHQKRVGHQKMGIRYMYVQRWIEAQVGHAMVGGGGFLAYVETVAQRLDDALAGDEMQLLWDLIEEGHLVLASYVYALMVRASCWVQTASHDRDACGCGRCYGVRRLDALYAVARAELAMVDDNAVAINFGSGVFEAELHSGPIVRDDMQYGTRNACEWLRRRFELGTWNRVRGVLVGDIVEPGWGKCGLELQAMLSTPEHVLAPVLMLHLMHNQVLYGEEYLHVNNVVYGPGPDETSGSSVWTFLFRHGVVLDPGGGEWLTEAQRGTMLAHVQAVYDGHLGRMADYAKERVEQIARERFGWGYLHLVCGLRVYVDGRGRTRNVERRAMQHFDASFAASAYGRTHWTPRLHRASPGLALTSRADAYATVGRVPRAMRLAIGTLLAGAQRQADVGVLPADLGDVMMWEDMFGLLERAHFWDA